jgi:hypothetical protein
MTERAARLARFGHEGFGRLDQSNWRRIKSAVARHLEARMVTPE